MAVIRDIATVYGGTQFRKGIEYTDDGKFFLITSKSVKPGSIQWGTVDRVNIKKHKNYVLGYDVIINKCRPFHSAVVGTFPRMIMYGNTLITHHLFGIRVADTERVLPQYLSWFLNYSSMCSEYILNNATTGYRSKSNPSPKTLNKDNIDNIPIVVPPVKEQLWILERVKGLDDTIKTCQNKIDLAKKEHSNLADSIK